MSVQVKISNTELNSLDYNGLVSVFETQSHYFHVKRYLMERYNRNKDFIKNMQEPNPVKVSSSTSIEKQLVDQAAGYGIGKPVTYYDKSDDNFVVGTRKKLYFDQEFVKMIDNEKKNALLKTYLGVLNDPNNTESLHNINLLKRALILGSADEMIFANENGDIEFALLEDDCISFVDTSVKPKQIGFARKIVYASPITGGFTWTYELYTNEKQIRYDEEGVSSTIGGVSNALLKIPFVRYDLGNSYIADLIANIRSYELVTNNTKKVLNYNDDALLVIKGYMFEEGASNEEIDKAIELIKTKGVMFLDSEDETKAEWLIKAVNDTTNQNHKENLKNDIYTVAGTYNPAKDSQVYQNTLSLVFKQYGLETLMSSYVQVLRKGFKDRCNKIVELINFRDSTNFDSSNIDMTFTRNLPTNINEELNLVNQARDILPLKAIYEMLSFVENPDEMVERYKAWQLELSALEVQKAEIVAKATEDDMIPDSMRYTETEIEELDELEEAE